MQVITVDQLGERIRSRSRSMPYADVTRAVSDIIEDVRARGDLALVDSARKYDRVDMKPDRIEVTPPEIDLRIGRVDPDVASAIEHAWSSVYAFHLRGVPTDTIRVSAGMRVIQKVEPLGLVGIYSPRGTHGYPSSVIMAASAARAAGVKQIVLCTPPDATGNISPAVLYAARVCGVSRVFRAGGAAAVAAMAFGTDSVPAVDKIVGPGNEYVSEAKRLVFGRVGIDMIAGPSEVAIIASESAQPEIVAYDLMAQAEHGINSWAVLLTNSRALMARVQAIIESTGPECGQISGVLVESLQEACELATALAPEHLEVFGMSAGEAARSVSCCGAIFIGPYAGAPLGDYSLGPNHILPTAGTARFSSTLSALDFVRFTNIVEITAPPSHEMLRACEVLAHAEGYTRHRDAVRLRAGRALARPQGRY